MKIGTTSIETQIAKTPLAIVSSPSVGPTFSSWSGSGFRLAGKLPARSTWIRCSTSLALKPCGPPSMIPESRISELIAGADITRLSSKIASW